LYGCIYKEEFDHVKRVLLTLMEPRSKLAE